MSTKIKIQTAQNGLILIVDHGYRETESDAENMKEIFVYEDSNTEGKENEAMKSLFYQLTDTLGMMDGKYSERRLHLIERPGSDFENMINDDEYLREMYSDLHGLLTLFKNQFSMYRANKAKMSEEVFSWGLPKKKMDKILAILGED